VVDGATVIFVHLPKTGGVTLTSILKRQYRREMVYPFDPTDRGAPERLRNLPEQERREIKLIHGHMSFGLHKLLSQPATYITLLRHPVARAVSDYRFVSTNPWHPLHNEVKKMSLSTYLQSGATGQLSNGQTRLLSGDCDGDRVGMPTRSPMSKKDLDSAKQNIRHHFSVVGLQEHFDRSLVLIAQALGWRRTPYYVRANVTVSKVRSQPISKEDIALIQQQNALDIELYDFVKRRFLSELNTQGARYHIGLAKLRALNAGYKVGTFLTLDSRSTPNLRNSVGAVLRRIR